MTRLAAALFNTARFSRLDLARETAARQVYHTEILLGDDGKFWVPATHREAGELKRAGYEAPPKN